MPRLWFINTIPIHKPREGSPLVFALYFLAMLIGLGKLGRGPARLALPIWGTFLYMNLLYLPLHVIPRYGVPGVPSLLALSGIGLYALAQWGVAFALRIKPR